jgi:hypothetical protein
LRNVGIVSENYRRDTKEEKIIRNIYTTKSTIKVKKPQIKIPEIPFNTDVTKVLKENKRIINRYKNLN